MRTNDALPIDAALHRASAPGARFQGDRILHAAASRQGLRAGPLPEGYPLDLEDIFPLVTSSLVLRAVLPRDASMFQDFIRGLSRSARRDRF